MTEDTTVPLAAGSPPSGGGRGGVQNRRRRNRNRNANKSKSRSPARDDANGGNNNDNNRQTRPNKSRSPARSNKSRSPARNNKSRSPTRNNKSRSPARNNNSRSPTRNNQSRSPMRNHHRAKKQNKPPAPAKDITVIVNRSYLWDSAAHFQPEENQQQHHQQPEVMVSSYFFAPDVGPGAKGSHNPHSVAVTRVPHSFEKGNLPVVNPDLAGKEDDDGYCDVIDTSVPNPHDPNVVHDKYWCQRRRLFSRFDRGIKLDSEGWYSVTPEIIADHVAHRVADLAMRVPSTADGQGIVILDAFCGCGGNSIAFGKIPSNLVSKVVCCDTDRTKLLKAAHNASLYDIPKDKLVFVECNSAFILQYCYKNGEFILDKPTCKPPPYLPSPVMPKTYSGYKVGGLDMLPRRIDAVFMDPPWGGVDYELLGKNGYDLQKNMKIQVGPGADPYSGDGDGVDDFFDNFSTPSNKMSQKARKANFNKKTDGDFIDGMELLRVAAEATSLNLVMYDLPRNTSKNSLGRCALGAGYRGNLKLEEHYLNGRLKTVTAYMGADYSELITSLHDNDHGAATSGDEA